MEHDKHKKGPHKMNGQMMKGMPKGKKKGHRAKKVK